MPVKIAFKVISSSGEDENFRATELNYHDPTVRGWRSSMNCIFPQEIILQLKTLAILQQIQILSHHYLIPQKIEICTSTKLDYDKQRNHFGDVFECLGFITFSDNKATGFRSRELKSIMIPFTKAKYVKLKIHSNHENAKNVNNQVGLMAVNVIGEELHYKTQEGEMNNNIGFHSIESIASLITCNSNYISPYDDLAFEMSVDQETARIIKIIEYKMLQALLDERLHYAKQLKITLENLRAAGEILGVYEQEKKLATNLEDYDRAKYKKFQIDNFRHKIYSSLQVDKFLESIESSGNRDLNSNGEDKPISSDEDTQIENRAPSRERTSNACEASDCEKSPSRSFSFRSANQLIHSRSHTSFRGAREAGPASPAVFEPPIMRPSLSNPHLQRASKDHMLLGQKPGATLGPVRTLSTDSSSPSERESSPPEPFKARTQHNWNESLTFLGENTTRRNYDDSIAFQKEERSSLTLENREESKLKQLQGENKKRSRSTTNPVKSSFQAYEDRMLPALRRYHRNEVVKECQQKFDQQRKSKLNEREKKQAMLPISVFGIELIEKFYSKSFNDKEEGLKELKEELKRDRDNSESGGSWNKVARAATFLLHRTLRDKVYSVYSSAAETVRFFFAEHIPKRVSLSEVARSVEKLLPELLNKSGDPTPRIHNMAAHTILSMAECEEVRKLNIIPAHLSRPLMSSVHPRLALSRLEMVEQLILSHGISQDKKSGLTCRTLAEFGSSGLHHPAEAVRKVSERILIRVYEVNPRIVRKQLPPDDNVTRRNLLYRHLFQEFDFIDVQRKLSKKGVENSKPKETNRKEKVIQSFESNQKINDEEFSIAEKEDRKNRINDPDLETNKNIPSLSSNEENQETKKSFLKRTSEHHDNFQKGLKLKERSALKKSEKNTTSKAFSKDVKFPLLADFVQTTKPPKSLELNKSLTCTLPKGQTTLKSSLLRRGGKLKNNSSGIPLPTFGSTRELEVKLKNDQKQGTSSNLQRSWDSYETKDKPTKIKGHDFAKKDKRVVSSEVDNVEKISERMPLKETVMEGSIKFSDSMLASIRENEFTESLLRGTSPKTCIFCLSSKEWTTEDSLNKHYLKDCMMLTTCEYCMEVTEISGFNHHLLVDCKWKHMFHQCKNCHEAILGDLYYNHECTAQLETIHKLKCPFCHTYVENKDSSWRKHLVGKNICPNHPRQKESILSVVLGNKF